jgi:hypothetical protein
MAERYEGDMAKLPLFYIQVYPGQYRYIQFMCIAHDLDTCQVMSGWLEQGLQPNISYIL